MTELQGGGAAERVAEDTQALHVDAAWEPAGRVRRVQSFHFIDREAHVRPPGLHQPGSESSLLMANRRRTSARNVDQSFPDAGLVPRSHKQQRRVVERHFVQRLYILEVRLVSAGASN
jgi:hypothetical protein